jgi:hypothetical protein
MHGNQRIFRYLKAIFVMERGGVKHSLEQPGGVGDCGVK